MVDNGTYTFEPLDWAQISQNPMHGPNAGVDMSPAAAARRAVESHAAAHPAPQIHEAWAAAPNMNEAWRNGPSVNDLWGNGPNMHSAWANGPNANWLSSPNLRWFDAPRTKWFDTPNSKWFREPGDKWFDNPNAKWFTEPNAKWFDKPNAKWLEAPTVHADWRNSPRIHRDWRSGVGDLALFGGGGWGNGSYARYRMPALRSRYQGFNNYMNGGGTGVRRYHSHTDFLGHGVTCFGPYASHRTVPTRFGRRRIPDLPESSWPLTTARLQGLGYPGHGSLGGISHASTRLRHAAGAAGLGWDELAYLEQWKPDPRNYNSAEAWYGYGYGNGYGNGANAGASAGWNGGYANGYGNGYGTGVSNGSAWGYGVGWEDGRDYGLNAGYAIGAQPPHVAAGWGNSAADEWDDWWA